MVSSRTPNATANPNWARGTSGNRPSTAKVAAKTIPADVITAPVTVTPLVTPARVPMRQRLVLRVISVDSSRATAAAEKAPKLSVRSGTHGCSRVLGSTEAAHSRPPAYRRAAAAPRVCARSCKAVQLQRAQTRRAARSPRPPVQDNIQLACSIYNMHSSITSSQRCYAQFEMYGSRACSGRRWREGMVKCS